MSLKTDFFDGATGLQAKCNDAFDAGAIFVTVDNLAAISAALIDEAAKGNTKFTVSLVTTYNTTILRGNKGNNLILKSYLAGITKGLADQDVYAFECTPALNIVDPNVTKVDLNFNFQST